MKPSSNSSSSSNSTGAASTAAQRRQRQRVRIAEQPTRGLWCPWHPRALLLGLGISNVLLGVQRAWHDPHHRSVFVDTLMLDANFMRLFGVVQAVVGVLLVTGVERALTLLAATLLHVIVVVASLSVDRSVLSPLRRWPWQPEDYAAAFSCAWVLIHVAALIAGHA